MNFLAHIYLSGENPEVQLGNFMADAVKGSQFKNFSAEIQKGILLHRFIDTYTDAHPVFRQSKGRLHGKQFGHYTAVIMDMFYDHFLAANWSQYHPLSLQEFSTAFYKMILGQKERTPERTQHLIPYMIEQNWLMQYQSIEGLDLILSQMNRRTKGRSNMDQAVIELRDNYREFEAEFHDFFKSIQGEVAVELKRLNS